MTKSERKLCRRGLEACTLHSDDTYVSDSSVDVMVLQAGCGEEVLTAVGLSTEALFSHLQVCDIRSHEAMERAVKSVLTD